MAMSIISAAYLTVGYLYNKDNSVEIKEVSSISALEADLKALLIDSVESGASVGFLAPVSSDTLTSYWDNVERDLQLNTRKLFVALDQNRVIGAVQLQRCAKSNATHRGEVEKLMVKTAYRGQGVSKKLMSLMEQTAKEIGLSLLVLDTRSGDVASFLYRAIDYSEVGQIPNFARSLNGELDATVYFYKQL
jgi:acetyltransferase